MAERREKSQMLGDFLREGAVLVLVFLPLEAFFQKMFGWLTVLLAVGIAGALLYWGMILEGRDEL